MLEWGQLFSGEILWRWGNGPGDNFPREQLSSGTIVRGAIIQEAIMLGTIIQGAVFLGGNCPRTISRICQF